MSARSYKKVIEIISKMDRPLTTYELALAQECPARFVRYSQPAAREEAKYRVFIESCGHQKIAVIKAMRAIANLWLKEAKEIADTTPSCLPKEFTKASALSAMQNLTAAGAVARIEPV